ncbi:MAG TPA: SctF chaperone SctG [Rhabdochlamydiaceae bacterium]|nr:SctF chaperone SctG [Rhabdochlamydiaceae bacterium]
MASLQKFKDHFFLLCEAGFVAVNQADEDAAVKLFRASALINPASTLPKIGMGYMHMMKLELKQAIKIFDEIMAIEPHNDMAKAFLGICYALTTSEVAKGEKILEQSAQKAEDPMIKKLAVTALDFVEKFVKKAPSPVELQKSEKDKKKKK